MNCYTHPENAAVGTCTTCGKPICSQCAVEMQGKLTCRECLSAGRVRQPSSQAQPDPNNAFLIELVGGLFGFLGLGYFYVGRTNDGILRLILYLGYNVTAYVVIALLSTVVIGCFCIPVQLAIQIGVAIWSASTLKKQLLGQ